MSNWFLKIPWQKMKAEDSTATRSNSHKIQRPTEAQIWSSTRKPTRKTTSARIQSPGIHTNCNTLDGATLADFSPPAMTRSVSIKLTRIAKLPIWCQSNLRCGMRLGHCCRASLYHSSSFSSLGSSSSVLLYPCSRSAARC